MCVCVCVCVLFLVCRQGVAFIADVSGFSKLAEALATGGEGLSLDKDRSSLTPKVRSQPMTQCSGVGGGWLSTSCILQRERLGELLAEASGGVRQVANMCVRVACMCASPER